MFLKDKIKFWKIFKFYYTHTYFCMNLCVKKKSYFQQLLIRLSKQDPVNIHAQTQIMKTKIVIISILLKNGTESN